MSKPNIPFDENWQKWVLKDEIKRKRKTDKSATQLFIAKDILRINEFTFSSIVNGKSRLTEANAKKLAKYFEVRSEYLLGIDKDHRTENDYTKAIVENFNIGYNSLEKLIEHTYSFFGYRISRISTIEIDDNRCPFEKVWYSLSKRDDSETLHEIGEFTPDQKDFLEKEIEDFIGYKLYQLEKQIRSEKGVK